MPRPSDKELYRLFDRSPIGIYRSTADGRFLYVNPSLARILGYTVDELLALNLNRDVWEDPEARGTLIEQYRSTGGSDGIDGLRVAWRARDGSRRMVLLYGHVVEDDVEPSFDASVVDVTETDAQHADLERTALILDLVVRQIPAMYWIVDTDLRIVQTGGAVEQVLGYPQNKFINHTLGEVHSVEPGTVDPVETHRRALAGDTVWYLTEYRSKQLSTTTAPLRSGGVIVGAIGTALDVTFTRALERGMVDAQRAESLGVLAGGLAHDFNNLLVAILGNADLALRDIPQGTPGRASIENIRSAGLRAAELTDQLLAYAGRGGLPMTRLEPAPIVDELLRISAPSMPKTTEVVVEITPDLIVHGDPSQIRQILLNLIVNARDALGDGGGTITISGYRYRHDGVPNVDDIVVASAGTYALLEIADDGPGIDRESRRRIFEPFFSTKASGHGLGLAAIVGIVRSHGGGLRLVSAPGDGARFQVLLPTTATPTQLPAIVGALGRTVLVIDDEDLVRDVVARMIEELGYSALTAADGQAGLAIVAAQPIDAVLVDLTMPLMSGADVITALRRRQPTLPLILCSGFDRGRKGAEVVADAYLPKPFRMEALELTLAKLLG